MIFRENVGPEVNPSKFLGPKVDPSKFFRTQDLTRIFLKSSRPDLRQKKRPDLEPYSSLPDSPARGCFSFSRQFRPSLIQCSKKKVTRIKKNSSQDFLLRESGKQNTYRLSCQNLVFLTFLAR